ncbi:MAG TPA: acyl carrier protein [Streptosporangiaceae bacterium]
MTHVTFEKVAGRMSDLLSIPVEKLTPQTALNDLAVDSFQMVETVVDLQEEFGTVFTQAALKQVSTVGELAELLRTGQESLALWTRARSSFPC